MLKRAPGWQPRALVDRFNEKVAMCPMSGCWLWTASTDEKGYGAIGTVGRNTELAHRVAYELFNGPIPDGLCVLHRCDVPSCVNPAHLFVGTQLDNNRDRSRKGRNGACRGEANHKSKIGAADVLEIRRLYRTGLLQREIGERFGLTQAHVSAIVGARAWKQLPSERAA